VCRSSSPHDSRFGLRTLRHCCWALRQGLPLGRRNLGFAPGFATVFDVGPGRDALDVDEEVRLLFEHRRRHGPLEGGAVRAPDGNVFWFLPIFDDFAKIDKKSPTNSDNSAKIHQHI
jgi:hypothetical protein